MHEEILALIENLLGNLISKKLKGVLSLRMMDNKFRCRDVRVPAHGSSLSLQYRIVADDSKRSIRVLRTVGDGHANFHVWARLLAQQRNGNQATVLVQGVKDALNYPA